MLFALGVAVVAPSIAAIFGVSVRWLASIGLGGAVVLWLMLTVTSPSDDRELTKAGYMLLWAGALLIWFALWMVATLIAVALRAVAFRRGGKPSA